MCTMRSMNTVPEIIALDFYDGATEGYIRELHNRGPYYFRMIAWDDSQEQRLFAATSVDQTEFDELVVLLKPDERSSSAVVWVPEWQFQDPSQEKRANNIVGSSQEKLQVSGVLILGSQITDSRAREIEYREDLARLVRQSLSANDVGRVGDWVRHFQ